VTPFQGPFFEVVEGLLNVMRQKALDHLKERSLKYNLAKCEYCPDFAATVTAIFSLCRIKGKKNSYCSAYRHQLQYLTRLLLDCFACEPRQRSIFGPDLEAWPDFWVLAEFLCAPFPRKGWGSTIITFTIVHQCLFLLDCQSEPPSKN